MAATLATVALALAKASTVDGQLQLRRGAGITALVAASPYVVSFSVRWGPVMWVVLGEMFPNQIHSPSLALAVSFISVRARSAETRGREPEAKTG